jgi:hypothetical protein
MMGSNTAVEVGHFDYKKNHWNRQEWIWLCSFCRAFRGASFVYSLWHINITIYRYVYKVRSFEWYFVYKMVSNFIWMLVIMINASEYLHKLLDLFNFFSKNFHWLSEYIFIFRLKKYFSISWWVRRLVRTLSFF